MYGMLCSECTIPELRNLFDIITPCACAQQGQSDRFVHLSACPWSSWSFSNEGLVEGLVQN